MSVLIIRTRTGLPESSFVASADFIGDHRIHWSDDIIFRVVCSHCGLIDKASTERDANQIKRKHLRGNCRVHAD